MGMKGHPQSTCGGGGSGGGSGGWMLKNKMVMVAVVILAGVLGVMVVQKVKDRRLFNLVIKEKDRQILSLNLLLQLLIVQKERQYAKENKRKNQDLNAKLYSLRTQKTDLVNKIMEMRSTIDSMRDEHQALELAIDEKQNEIKLKESEIRDMRSSLQTPPKIWSGNSIDPSNHEVNLTSKVTTTNVKKPNHQDIIKPYVKVQKPKDEDSEKLASYKGHIDNAKIEMNTTTNGRLAIMEMRGSEENGIGLAMKGRKFFIGATESQRDKSNGQNEKSQLKANLEEGPTEVTQNKSNRTNGEAGRVDEDEAETEVDVKSSKNGSEEDRDDKEETEE
ncbi:hypothetical protein R6Q57_012869 [Mikania cordata]